MHLGNALAIYNLCGLFQHSGQFSVLKDEAFLSYFGLKNQRFTFSERDFSALTRVMI